MTLDEAIKILKGTYDFTKDKSYNNYDVNIDRKLHKAVNKDEALKMAIKALEQEPILDKIRAEISDLDDVDYDYEGYYKAVTDALQIIDKYKADMRGEAYDKI